MSMKYSYVVYYYLTPKNFDPKKDEIWDCEVNKSFNKEKEALKFASDMSQIKSNVCSSSKVYKIEEESGEIEGVMSFYNGEPESETFEYL